MTVRRIVANPLPAGADIVLRNIRFNSAFGKSFSQAIITGTKNGRTKPLLKLLKELGWHDMVGEIPGEAESLYVGFDKYEHFHIWVNRDPGCSYSWHSDLNWRNWDSLARQEPVPEKIVGLPVLDLQKPVVFTTYLWEDGFHVSDEHGIILKQPDDVRQKAFILTCAGGKNAASQQLWEKALREGYVVPPELEEPVARLMQSVDVWQGSIKALATEALKDALDKAHKALSNEEIEKIILERPVERVIRA